jgi:C4-dicarboxylate-specific signal transduction histidine kinase
MNPERFREAYGKLQALDDRLTHRVRPRSSTSRLTAEQVEDRMRDLATYTVELKEIVDELFQAIAAKPG